MLVLVLSMQLQDLLPITVAVAVEAAITMRVHNQKIVLVKVASVAEAAVVIAAVTVVEIVGNKLIFLGKASLSGLHIFK
jgi:hypothetical protein